MANDIDARIGTNLRELRLKAGLDLDGLAGRTGLQPAALSGYETGRTRVPVEVLTYLAAVLDQPLGAFFA